MGRLFVALLVASGSWLWLYPITGSFWLDECGAIFRSRGGLGELIERHQIFISSLPFELVLWGVGKVFGHGEVAMRLPSVVAMTGAGLLLYGYVRRHLGVGTGCLAVALFVVHGEIRAHVAEARPYAMLALALAASLYLLERWMSGGGWRWALALGLVAGLMPAIHLTAAVTLPVLVATWLAWGRRAWEGRGGQLVVVGFGFAMTAPLAVVAYRAIERLPSATDLNFLGKPTVAQWLALYGHPLGLAVGMGVVVAMVLAGYPRWVKRRVALPLVVAVAGLAVGVPLLMFLVSRLTPLELFLPRYMMGAVLGVVLLYALALDGVEPERFRMGVACGLLVLASGYLAYSGRGYQPRYPDQWKPALASLKGSMQRLYIQTGFTEGRLVAWLREPVRREFLAAPATGCYPGGVPVEPLPYADHQQYREYVREQARLARQRGETVGLVVYGAPDRRHPFVGEFADAGFAITPRGQFGVLGAMIATPLP